MSPRSSKRTSFRLAAIFIVLLPCLFMTSKAERPSSPPDFSNASFMAPRLDPKFYEGSYALVIGDSEYTNGWRPLPGVARDVKKVSEALKEMGFEVELLTNLKQVELDQALRKFVDERGQTPGNRLIVYFAGHGWTISDQDGRESGYIVPSDAPSPDKGDGPFRRVAMNLMQINVFASDIRAKHALFLFDSCFSGALLEANRGYKAPLQILDAMDKPVRLYITAGAKNQEVPDNGVFADKFISGLRGDADLNNDDYITGTELGRFLAQKIKDSSSGAQTPRWGTIRDPLLDKGDVVFASPKAQNSPSPRPTPVTAESQAAENLLWNQAGVSNDLPLLVTYLERYPKGKFAPQASARLANLYFDRAKKLLDDESNDEAEINLLAGLRLNRDSPRGHLSMGILLFRRRQIADARMEFKQVLAAEPDNPEAHYRMGAAFKEQKQVAEGQQELDIAMRLVNAALAKDPNNPDLHGLRSGILHYQGDYRGEETEARRALALARQLNPTDTRWYERLGAALMAQSRWSDAEREYRAAIELMPNSARWHSSLGYVLGEMGRFKEAEPELQQGLRLDPKRGQSYVNLGVILARQKNRWPEAEAAYRKGIELDPQNAGLFHHFAYELSARGQHKEAERFYRLAAQFDPRTAAQHADLGKNLFEQKNYFEAEIAYREAARLDVRQSNYQDQLKKIRQKLGSR